VQLTIGVSSLTVIVRASAGHKTGKSGQGAKLPENEGIWGFLIYVYFGEFARISGTLSLPNKATFLPYYPAEGFGLHNPKKTLFYAFRFRNIS